MASISGDGYLLSRIPGRSQLLIGYYQQANHSYSKRSGTVDKRLILTNQTLRLDLCGGQANPRREVQSSRCMAKLSRSEAVL